jgi:hypothetical protein
VTPESTAAAQGAAGQEALKAEISIENYKIIAEWIRFADAKAAVTLTVNGVLMGLLIPTLKTYLADKDAHSTAWIAVVVVLFVAWLILLALSAIHSFLCILPFRGQGRQLALDHTTHFHPAAIAQKYAIDNLQQFLGDCESLATNGLKREVQAAILLDSHLSNSKYRYVTRAIWLLACSVVFGFFYLVAIQF